MARKCTCIRCQAEELVHNLYPKMDDRRVLLVAQDVVKAIRNSVDETRRTCTDVGGARE
jgi:hypothetical protein